jgi:GNAT superfamily N-acetyltransferase
VKSDSSTDSAQEIRIRPAGFDDIPQLLHHRRAMFAEMGEDDAGPLARMTETAEMYLRQALGHGCRGWVAETVEGRVVAGCLVVTVPWPGSPRDPSPRRAWILNMYTEPEWRRRGIARRLMETAVAWCRASGFAAVALHASENGRPLYEAMGFAPTNEMWLKLR